MGLVVQAPVDMLLPVAEPAQASAASAAETPEAGIFASLLASLATAVEGEAGDLGLDPAILPDGADKDGESAETANPFAALMAMTVPLQLQPQEATVTIATAPSEGIDAMAGGAANAAATFELPTEAASDAGVAADARTEATTAAEGSPAADIAPNSMPESAAQPAAGTVGPEAAAALAAASAEAPRMVPAGRGRPAEPSAEAPPTEASAAAAEPTSTSVVRNVGNAETESQDSTKGEGKPVADRPRPRASAQGIAHAAPNSAVGELRATQTAASAGAAPATDAPQAPAPEVPPQVEQVAHTVIEQVDAGGGEARIHLDPAGLGEVTIHVSTDGDSVRIDVRAERQEAAQLLRDHTQDLSSLLGERGLNLSDVNVGLGRGNSGQAWGQDNGPDNRPSGNEFASILGFDEPANVDTHNRLRAAYNPDGAHVYRV
jgi:flagellar hook-length control protein FliK